MMTSQIAIDLADTPQLTVQTACGGYVVNYYDRRDDERTMRTAVFSDVDLMCEFVKRVSVAWEGAYDDSDFIGPLRVEKQS